MDYAFGGATDPSAVWRALPRRAVSEGEGYRSPHETLPMVFASRSAATCPIPSAMPSLRIEIGGMSAGADPAPALLHRPFSDAARGAYAAEGSGRASVDRNERPRCRSKVVP